MGGRSAALVSAAASARYSQACPEGWRWRRRVKAGTATAARSQSPPVLQSASNISEVLPLVCCEWAASTAAAASSATATVGGCSGSANALGATAAAPVFGLTSPFDVSSAASSANARPTLSSGTRLGRDNDGSEGRPSPERHSPHLSHATRSHVQNASTPSEGWRDSTSEGGVESTQEPPSIAVVAEAFEVFAGECVESAAEVLRPVPGASSTELLEAARLVAATEWALMSDAERAGYQAAAALARRQGHNDRWSQSAPCMSASYARSCPARKRLPTQRNPWILPEWPIQPTPPAALSVPPLPPSPPNDEIYGPPGDRHDGDKVFAHPYVQELLNNAHARVARGFPWVVCIRTYGRSGLPEGGVMGIRRLTLRVLEAAGLGWASWRQRVHIFVSHEDPDFTSGRYKAALGPTWAPRMIVGLRGADLQVRFMEACFCRGQHVIVCDDNLLRIQRFDAGGDKLVLQDLRQKDPCELAMLFDQAGVEMAAHGAHLWGISQTHNPIYMSTYTSPLSSSLALIFGACFGFICLHEKELYTAYGQVKDDVERTLRYWHRDRVVLRFMKYAISKKHRPGSHMAKKGGISSSLSSDAHALEASVALQRMVYGFARPYVRLPLPHERKLDSQGLPMVRPGGAPMWKPHVSDTGLVFCGGATAHTPPGRGQAYCDLALRVGYVCRRCRPTCGVNDSDRGQMTAVRAQTVAAAASAPREAADITASAAKAGNCAAPAAATSSVVTACCDDFCPRPPSTPPPRALLANPPSTPPPPALLAAANANGISARENGLDGGSDGSSGDDDGCKLPVTTNSAVSGVDFADGVGLIGAAADDAVAVIRGSAPTEDAVGVAWTAMDSGADSANCRDGFREIEGEERAQDLRCRCVDPIDREAFQVFCEENRAALRLVAERACDDALPVTLQRGEDIDVATPQRSTSLEQDGAPGFYQRAASVEEAVTATAPHPTSTRRQTAGLTADNIQGLIRVEWQSLSPSEREPYVGTAMVRFRREQWGLGRYRSSSWQSRAQVQRRLLRNQGPGSHLASENGLTQPNGRPLEAMLSQRTGSSEMTMDDAVRELDVPARVPSQVCPLLPPQSPSALSPDLADVIVADLGSSPSPFLRRHSRSAYEGPSDSNVAVGAGSVAALSADEIASPNGDPLGCGVVSNSNGLQLKATLEDGVVARTSPAGLRRSHRVARRNGHYVSWPGNSLSRP
eukprot:TRINITY_DN34540_c0_g2_i1.p1 TRINITY_DN34540_c0_g2~~TRINITY_DN34540_c0_g2_i1.p1  ORF type:complete len:1202 (+),score=176.10 TRINITY_DN34540_c0_g2_i1:1-3606(+)